MLYQVFMANKGGTNAPFSTMLFADGIVEAERHALANLKDCQADGMMHGWTIQTVVEG